MSPKDFIQRWKQATGSELANAQLFTTELCELFGLPRPNPATGRAEDDAYVFERRTQHQHGDGSENERRIDCYRRGAFVLEAKKIKAGSHTKGYDDARMRARTQAEAYARDIPAAEGRVPFVVVVDVGRSIELYSEFTQSGATYVPYPDPRSYRIALADLERPEIQARLKALWLDPLSLNPARQSAKVTREVADALARIAKSLEASHHAPQKVAEFLTRCLFTFFAEDVKLLPEACFTDLLATLAKAPEQFVPMVGELWTSMDRGAFSVAIRKDVLRFNGKLFKNPEVLPLNAEQISLLHDAPPVFGSGKDMARAGVLQGAPGRAQFGRRRREPLAALEQRLRPALFGAPVEEGGREVRLHREPEIGSLDVVTRGQATAFGGEGLHAGPVADVLDHRVGMDQGERVVGVLRQGAGVAVDDGEQAGVGDLVYAARIDEGDPDFRGLQKSGIEQGPVVRLAAQIDDVHRSLPGVDPGDQIDNPSGAGAAEARHQRVGVGVVLEGVDQVHDDPDIAAALRSA